MPLVRTLEAPARVEIERIKGSRFVGDVAPVPDEAGALAFIEGIRAEFPDASHHCWAWRLDEDHTRSSDDGEPGGTAGEPILKRLVGLELHGVVLVVTRWFGGTKLGMGGLVRAYGAAATAVLEVSPLVQRPVTRLVRLTIPYDLSGPVQGVLGAHALVPVDETYGADVSMLLQVPVEQVDALLDDLGERTAGRAVVAMDDEATAGLSG